MHRIVFIGKMASGKSFASNILGNSLFSINASRDKSFVFDESFKLFPTRASSGKKILHFFFLER